MWELHGILQHLGPSQGLCRVSTRPPPGENARKALGSARSCKPARGEAEAHPSAPFTGEKSVSDRMCLEKPPGESVTAPEESRACLTSAKGQDTQ